jgi:hypothetical protein
MKLPVEEEPAQHDRAQQSTICSAVPVAEIAPPLPVEEHSKKVQRIHSLDVVVPVAEMAPPLLEDWIAQNKQSE